MTSTPDFGQSKNSAAANAAYFLEHLREYHASVATINSYRILHDGRQDKSYLYVHDCIDAIFPALVHVRSKVNVLNFGTNDYCEVTNSTGWTTSISPSTPRSTTRAVSAAGSATTHSFFSILRALTPLAGSRSSIFETALSARSPG